MSLKQILEQDTGSIRNAILRYLKESTLTKDYLEDLVLLTSAIIQLRPNEADAYIAKGSALIDLGMFGDFDKFIEALDVLTKAVELNPRAALAYFHIGRMYLIMEDYGLYMPSHLTTK